MTIEQKAKAYDKAIEKAKALYQAAEPMSGCNVLLETVFPELKKSEDENIRKCLLGHFSRYQTEEVFLNSIKMGDIVAWLEKQGEQKPTDKVEPKFKVGDWIIGRVTSNEPRQISEITDQCYKSTYGGQYGFSFEDEMHLWTIQDAKDGDVLVHNDCTFIFMGIKDGIVQAIEENMLKLVPFGEPDKDNDYHPATKEQRDLLFQKITEAGYEWDAEKKELKEIEQLTTFEEAVKDMMNAYRDAIGDIDATIEEIKKHSEYLLSLIPQKPAEWSEDDEKAINDIMWIIEAYRKNGFNESHKQTANNAENWFKSLKDKMQPKQEWSEDDNKYLHEVENCICQCVNTIGTVNKVRYCEWLKSLRPQNMCTYNPYKTVVESITEMCKHYDKATDLQDFYDNVKVKCKDAKEYDSLYPQNTWKPSDEQIIALRWVLNNIPYNKHKEEISELLDQIKDL